MPELARIAFITDGLDMHGLIGGIIAKDPMGHTLKKSLKLSNRSQMASNKGLFLVYEIIAVGEVLDNIELVGNFLYIKFPSNSSFFKTIVEYKNFIDFKLIF
ncbi:hypothetical protein J2Z69_001011 [Paenibacillus shirakamiensis]|uniref:Uncharacterized protein n=1 Tax=Paenibacillus shirakamiensis TaxID=1265935 RepID=A0ABS4JE45_9BACL|nr:hypothetical protein [Paenibacillus shirakamiensis]MBP1999992.1 hypothetical protein [Paenibacillus shirakamiensis]